MHTNKDINRKISKRGTMEKPRPINSRNEPHSKLSVTR